MVWPKCGLWSKWHMPGDGQITNICGNLFEVYCIMVVEANLVLSNSTCILISVTLVWGVAQFKVNLNGGSLKFDSLGKKVSDPPGHIIYGRSLIHSMLSKWPSISAKIMLDVGMPQGQARVFEWWVMIGWDSYTLCDGKAYVCHHSDFVPFFSFFFFSIFHAFLYNAYIELVWMF